MAEDIQLLRHYAEHRAEDAFTALVERHVAFVYSAALRQLDGAVHRAEDVTQTVFISLARQAVALSRRDDIVGWLYLTTHHAAAKLKRAEARRQAREQEAHIMHELLSDSSAEAEWARLRPVLDDAMLELGERDREVVLLRFFRDARFADVGRKLGLSEDAARMRVERALDKLHALLAKRGVTSTSAALATVLANQAVASAPAGLAASVTGAALSGAAAAGAGPLSSRIYFMSASQVTVSLAAAGVLALAAAVYQSTQADGAAKTLADARRDHAALATRLADLGSKVKFAEKELLNREVALARRREVKAAAEALAKPSPEALAAAAQRAKFEAARAKLSDPEIAKARLSRDQWQRVAQFRPFFSSLGLTPDQIRDLAKEGGSPATLLPAIREKFGDAAAGRLKEFIDTLPARSLVNDLSARTFYADDPFTAQQAEQLVQIVANARPAVTPERTAHEFAAGLFQRTLDWDAILAQAKAILSPTQMQGLRGLAAEARIAAQYAAADSKKIPTP